MHSASRFNNQSGLPISGFINTLKLILIILLAGCATPSIRVTTEQNQGDICFNQHDYSKAVRHYNLMLEASRKLGIYRNPAMESDVHRKIANCFEMTGDYESALSTLRDAFKIDSANNYLNNLISDFRQQGKVFIYMGLSQDGIRALEKSLSLSDGMDQSLKNVNKISIADNYLVLGQLYSVMGQTGKALDYVEKAQMLFQQANDNRGEMESILTLANIKSDLGDNFESRLLAEKSLKKALDLGLGTSRHNQLLASVAAETGEYENALRYQEKALAEARDFKIMGQLIWTTIGMGDIYSKLGDFNKAEKYYREARLIKDTLAMNTKSLDASLNLRMGEIVSANEYFSSEGSFTGEAISSLRIAELLIKKGRSDSAFIFLDQSEVRFKAAGNREGLNNVLLLKGRVLVDKGNPADALPLLESASQSSDFPETAWQAYFHLGRVYEEIRQDEKAVESYRNSISIIEKIRGNLTIDEFKSSYFESKREVYDRLLRLLLKLDRTGEAFQVSEEARARAFYDILANKKIDYKGSVPGDLISMEQSKRIEIQKLYKLLQKSDANESDGNVTRSSGKQQLRRTLAAAQSEYEEIIRTIKLNNPAYAEIVAAEPVNIQDLKKEIDDRTAILAYWLSENQLTCWLLTKSETISKIMKIDEKQLAALVEDTRKYISSNSIGETTDRLAKLYSILIAPFESKLSEFTNLVIIPNGSLHFLPFQALINSSGQYLIERYNLTYAPSASVFMVCNNREKSPGAKFMGMALSDIIIDGKPGLPGTEDELRKILPLFASNISAFGNQSTETFVKNNAGNYNFIHFATHGSYNYKRPLYSFLLFNPSEDDDGRLNVFEVLELSINANLVTLSACETGLGNISQGDELVGLSRAFLFAGSSSVLVSLWAVSDYPTSLLMANFYRYLNDHNLQEALTLAQRDVIKIYPQPQYWSPFILIGNGQISIN
jgi:CHAT domain-containing protein